MRIARVVLHNVKSYAGPTTIPLELGINAICGENGAGKSTVLEAIGFALFGYRPYRLDAFLREGEKSGSITVTVEDDDGCRFDVVRKLGSGAGQAVYDELGQRVAEGESDVRSWVLDFLRLDPSTDLAKLFEDTVGPPQGTLTAIFLESAGPRAKKFDRLLQIEDYGAAAQALRSVSNLFRDRAAEADRKAALLEGDARRLPQVEERLRETKLRKADLKVAAADARRRHAELRSAWERMEGLRQAVQEGQSEVELASHRATDAKRRLEERAAELRRAEVAVRLLEENRSGYSSYQEASDRLRLLNQRRQERDRLRQSAEMAARTALKWEQELRAAQDRLKALDRDQVRLRELQGLIPEQERWEEEVRRWEERLRAREEAARQLPLAEARLEDARTRFREAEERLRAVEEARPMASRWADLRSQGEALREEMARLEEQAWLLKRAEQDLEEARGRRQTLLEELDRLKRGADELRALEGLAEMAAARQMERDAAHGAVEGLRASLREARRSRSQVEGGLCPFFHEPCRNLRPGISLDGHFDAVIASLEREIAAAEGRLAEADAALEESRRALAALVRLPDLDRRIAELDQENTTLASEIDSLSRTVGGLSDLPAVRERKRKELLDLEPELARAEAARQIVAGEAGWRGQAEQAARAVERERQMVEQLRSTLERESGAEDGLVAARRGLEGIGDPRGEALALRQRIDRERPEVERSLERAQREAASARTAEERCRRELEPYDGLEEELATWSRLRDESEPSYRCYLENQSEAGRLEQRRAAHQRALAESEESERRLAELSRALEEMRARYDEAEQLRVRGEMDAVAAEVAAADRELELCEGEEERLLREVEDLLVRKTEMESAQAEAAEARRMMDAVEAVRRTLDAAGPEIARALLRRISARATGIFRELLGQPTISLEWDSDYEIRCRIRSEEREFKQLSGGEQMGAALAVRLALLQTLSNLRMAFLDEPTAHMDDVRRSNLASQIQNLRSFDQLVVISHDDSFDTLFGHVVRLSKRAGATVVEE